MKTIRTKTEAVKLFGSQVDLADALGISKQAISQWPERLTQRQRDEILGAAIRTGKLSCDSKRKRTTA